MPRNPIANTAEVRKLRGANPGFEPSVAFGHAYASKRPEHVLLVGECIIAWTAVETYLAVLLSALLRTDTNATIAVYSTLRRAAPRHATLVKAAEHMLDAEGQLLIKALLSYVSALETERNDLAHGWWGVSFEIEDGLAWAAQEHVTLTQVEMNKAFLGKAQPGLNAKVTQQLREKVFLYRKNDLQGIKSSFITAMYIISDFRGYISTLRGEPPLSLEKKERDKLLGFAPIREALEVLRRRDAKQTRKERPQKPPLPDPS